jgi:hypothetical protein
MHLDEGRERRMYETLRMQQSGLTRKVIASQLGVHISTVGDYLATMRYRALRGESNHSEPGNPNGRNPTETGADERQITYQVRNLNSVTLEEPGSRNECGWSDPESCNAAWQKTRNFPGLYKWFLNDEMPIDANWPQNFEPLVSGTLIYVGRATNIRSRAKHHRLPTAGSTLRRTLASLLGYPAIWVGKSAHPRISAADHEALSVWMSQNLLMSFREVPLGQDLLAEESALRKVAKAPFNKDALTPAQEFVSAVGKSWRVSASDSRADEQR